MQTKAETEQMNRQVNRKKVVAVLKFLLLCIFAFFLQGYIKFLHFFIQSVLFQFVSLLCQIQLLFTGSPLHYFKHIHMLRHIHMHILMLRHTHMHTNMLTPNICCIFFYLVAANITFFNMISFAFNFFCIKPNCVCKI